MELGNQESPGCGTWLRTVRGSKRGSSDPQYSCMCQNRGDVREYLSKVDDQEEERRGVRCAWKMTFVSKCVLA